MCAVGGQSGRSLSIAEFRAAVTLLRRGQNPACNERQHGKPIRLFVFCADFFFFEVFWSFSSLGVCVCGGIRGWVCARLAVLS